MPFRLVTCHLSPVTAFQMSLTDFEGIQTKIERPAEARPLQPTREELAVLSRTERAAFRLAHRMNRGRWKQFWTFCQRTLGAGWIHLATYNIMRVRGLEHLEAVSHERPL